MNEAVGTTIAKEEPDTKEGGNNGLQTEHTLFCEESRYATKRRAFFVLFCFQMHLSYEKYETLTMVIMEP